MTLRCGDHLGTAGLSGLTGHVFCISRNLMGWMAPASIGVAMRHIAGVDICL